MDIDLTPRGTLATSPKLVNPKADRNYFYVSRAALKAVATCAPYKLPLELYSGYGGWKAITLHFDPN